MIPTICSFLQSQDIFSSNSHFDIVAFNKIFSLIFSNNVFSFKDRHFKQTIGLPMGCVCGPSVANLYLAILEHNWLQINEHILIYKRFIDDIFIFTDSEMDTDLLQKQFLYLKLNICEGEPVNFLDLSISFDYFTGKIIFSLYIKPTNSFSYLLTNSNHPPHIFKNIPKSLFTRIRRICTSYSDFLKHSLNLFVQLLKRGYKYKTLAGIIRSIGDKKREALLPYKINKKSESNVLLKSFSYYDENLMFMKNITINSVKELIRENKNLNFLKDKKFLFVHKIKSNLNNILLNNQKPITIHRKFCRKCHETNCPICPFLTETHQIHFRKFILPIRSNSNCTSLGIIYIIKCTKCDIYYVGQTEKNARMRIRQHLYSILFFKNNLDKSLTFFNSKPEIAIHFATHNHKLDDFTFYIFTSDHIELRERLSRETDTIHLLKNFNVKILNKMIPDIYKLSSLTFKD
jgi:hypothetical protein